MKTRDLAITVCALLTAGTAVADDFDRPGWYVGAGGGIGTDFFSEAIEDALGDAASLSTAGSFNMRGGYRIWSFLAVEGMYEGVYGIETKLLGSAVANSSYHSLFVNGKLIVPTWRIQPYFILGIGAQQGSFETTPATSLDLSRWDFAIRTGLGLDSYVTKNWVINLELTPSVRFTDYGNIPSELTDNVTLTFSAGIQYRF